MKKILLLSLLSISVLCKAQFIVTTSVVKINNMSVLDTVYVNLNKIVSMRAVSTDSCIISYEVANKSGIVNYKAAFNVDTIALETSGFYPKYIVLNVPKVGSTGTIKTLFNTDYISKVLPVPPSATLTLSTQTPQQVKVYQGISYIRTKINTILYNFTHQF